MSRVIKKTQVRIDDVRRFLESDAGAVAREKLAGYLSEAVSEGRALVASGKNPLTRDSHKHALGEALADALARPVEYRPVPADGARRAAAPPR